jgi:hypothetical protein
MQRTRARGGDDKAGERREALRSALTGFVRKHESIEDLDRKNRRNLDVLKLLAETKWWAQRTVPVAVKIANWVQPSSPVDAQEFKVLDTWNSLDAFCAGFVAVGDVVIMGAMNGKEVGSGTLSDASRGAIEARRSMHTSPVDPTDVATAIFVQGLRGPIVIEKILEASAGSPEILWREETRKMVYEAAHHKETLSVDLVLFASYDPTDPSAATGAAGKPAEEDTSEAEKKPEPEKPAEASESVETPAEGEAAAEEPKEPKEPKGVHGHFIARIGLECGFSLSEGLIGEFHATSIEFDSGRPAPTATESAPGEK